MSCVLYPQIKKNGVLQDSELFKGLTMLTSRRNTISLYNTIKYDDGDIFHNVVNDELGEPVLGSLISNFDLSEFGLTRSALEKKALELSLKEAKYKKSDKLRWSEYIEVFKERADAFNNSNPLRSVFLYTFQETKENGISYYSPKIALKGSIFFKEANSKEKELQASSELNKRLTGLLASWGISVGELTELDRRLGMQGVTDFNLANTKADGFIELIRLAKGDKGNLAFPEEFAHVALRMAKDSPLVNRMLALAGNADIMREVLGDDYSRYLELYEGRMDLLQEEVAGKLLAQALIGELKAPVNKSFISRVKDAILNFFKSKDEREIIKLKDEIASTYLDASQQILSGEFSKFVKNGDHINTFERLARLEVKAISKEELANKLIENTDKRIAIYSVKRNSDKYVERVEDVLRKLKVANSKANTDRVISIFVKNAVKDLLGLEEKFEALEKDVPVNIKAKLIRDIGQFLSAYKQVSADLGDVIKTDNGLEEDTVALIKEMLVLISNLESLKLNWSIPIVAEFLNEFYEGIDMENPFRKDYEVPSLETLIKEAGKDIGVVELWLDSIAQGTDMVFKMLDSANKNAKHRARLATIEYKNSIYEATIKLEEAGFKDQGFMFQRVKGKKTGLYIEKGSEDYNKLHPAQKEFYNTIIKLKHELEIYLPERYRNDRRTVKIRKDLLERAKSGEDIPGGFIDKLKRSVVQMTGEDQYGNKTSLMDFDGREVQNLPIYYVNTKNGESEEDITEDVSSSMIAYASMAIEFREMSKIIHSLELTRDVLRNREVQVNRGKSKLISVIRGKEYQVKQIQGQGTRLQERLDEYYAMQIYGGYIADEGTVAGTNIDKAKLADFVMRITAINSLSFNLLSSLANITQGVLMNEIELASSKYYDRRDLVKADVTYSNLLVPHLANIGSRVKTDFLSLFLDKFDVLQDYEERDKNAGMHKRNMFTKVFGSELLFVFQNAPEHWLQTRTSLALAYNYKMLDPNGKSTNLLEALEVVYTDPNNHNKGAKLQVKEGYTKEDGTEFSDYDVIKFSRKNAALNQRLNGIYNKMDRNKLQRYALGRMAFMFRKWMPSYWNRRYQTSTYNFDLEEWTEGYYRTTGKFAWALLSNLKQGRLNLLTTYRDLNIEQKRNLIMAAKEAGIFLILLGLITFIDWGEDDEERSYFSYLLEHQMRRAYMELGAFIPTTSMLTEGLKILQSPSATINQFERAIDLIGLFNPNNYEFIAGKDALIQTGRFKGDSRAERIFWRSPLIPMSNTMYKTFNPQDAITYYK